MLLYFALMTLFSEDKGFVQAADWLATGILSVLFTKRLHVLTEYKRNRIS